MTVAFKKNVKLAEINKKKWKNVWLVCLPLIIIG